MIASITGIIKSISSQAIVVEVGGVGILVQVTQRHAQSLVVGRTVSVHTSLLVREDSLTLFGFESVEDRAFFELLQTVTGIGPKVAQSALSAYGTVELADAISHENSTLLEKIPGLGKKGAARLVLELKDKVFAGSTTPLRTENLWRDQLVEALTGLGFSSKESVDAVEQVEQENSDAARTPIETLLKLALQMRGRK
jgi:holliday junction DNA helicase RuvA